MFNAGVRGKRAKDSTGLLTVGEHFNQQNYLIPTVTRFAVTDGSYVETNDTAADTAGNQTIVVYGSGFAPGATIIVGSTTISVVTFLDSGRLAFTSPALGSGSYTIFVTNANGGTGILVPGLVYSGVPTFTTAAGSLGTIYETTAINTSVVATGDAPITYALSSGSLPSGSTLSSGGTISGTAPVDGSSTTYSFTIQATDAQFQDSVRSFTLTITTDVVSFSSPANNTTTTITQNTAISNVTVVATSAAGYGVLYTSSGLPTGLSMNTSTGIISGTPTVAASNTSIITATANTTNRTATRYLNWTVNLPGDLFWKYAALLMTANTVSTGNTFNTDLSTYNNEVVVIGDTKPNGFNPFKEGYYSNYFDGSGDFLTTAATSVFANLWFGPNVTVECWVYFNSVSNTPHIWSFSESTSVRVTLYVATSVLKLYVVVSTGGDIITSPTTLIANRWYHVAITRNNSTWTMWLDGVSQGTSTSTSRPYGVNEMLAIGTQNYTPGAGDYLNGYISNFRAVSNTALYTAAFTPPTAPLTYTANTVLLTCQSNKLIDNSNNNFTITKNGDTTVNSFSPFNGTPTSVTVPGTNNYSVYFDGTGDYLTGPTNYPFITTGPFTIEFWVYQPSLALKALISNARWNIGQNGGFRVNLSASGAVVLDASTGTYNVYPNVFTTTSTITASTWTHIAIVRNSSNSISCYINGVLARTPVTYASSLSLSSDGNIGQFIVGAGIYDGGAADLFNGYMSNIRIINDALYTGNFTPSNSPLGLTQSSSANTAAITALPTNGGSVYFDGSSDYLSIANNAAFNFDTGDFTIELWFNFTSIGAAAYTFVSNYQGASAGWALQYRGDAGNVFRFTHGDTGLLNSSAQSLTVNLWYHLAASRNGTSLKLFLNGVQIASTTNSTSMTSASALWVGGLPTVGQYFPGYISNLRVVKGTAVYTANTTPSTTPLTVITNTSLLTCQSSSVSNNRIILDNGNNAFTITSVGDTIAKTLSPFANTPTILMAQANTVIDSSNNGITFTVAGDARPTRNGPFANTTTVTLIGNEGSTYFDGSGDYLSMSAIGNPLDWPASANYTIEAWVYLNAFTATESSCILARRNPTTTTTDWQFQISTTGALVLYNLNGATTITASSNLAIRQWNHCAAVISAGTARLYLNGALVSTPTAISAASTASVTTYVVGASNSVYLNGYISNLCVTKGTAVYTTPFVPSWSPLTPVANTVLLTAQTNLSSNTKVIVDESSNNSIVLGNGNVNSGSFSPFGSTWSGYFDGNGDYIAMPSSSNFNFGTGDFTVEAWVYWNSVSVNQGIISRYASSTSGWALRYDGSGLNWINGDTSILTTVHTPVGGTWYHYAVSRSGTTFRMFINGAQTASVTYSGNQDNNSSVYIGSLSNTLWFLTGYISNIRVLKGTALYTAAFTPSTNPLLPVANTILLTCNSNKFVDYSAANNYITKTGDASISRFSPFSPVPVTPASYSGYFDGSGDYLTVTSNTAFGLSTGDFTIESWIYPTAWTNDNGTIIDFRVSGGAGSQVKPRIYLTGGTLAYYVSGANRISTTLSSLNVWYHVSVVRLSGSTKLYVNGLQAGSTYTDANDYGSTAQDCVIGQVGDSRAFATGYFTGYISNLRVVKGTAVYTANTTPSTTPLTAIANTQLLTCQSTTFIDNSNNAFTITRNGDAKPVIQNPFTDTIGSGTSYTANTYGNSMYFDGTTDYLTVPYSSNFNIPASTPFTFECWAYTTSTNIFVMANRNWSFGSTGSTWGFGLNNGTSPFWSIGGTGASTYNMLNAGLPGALGQWNHYAWTRDSSNVCRVYTNGIEASSVTRTDSQAMTSASGSIFIGVSSNLASAYANGYMSNMRFLLGQCLYTSNFIPSNQPLPPTSNTVLLLSSTSGPSVTDALRISNMETTGTARQVANNSPYYDTYSGYFDGTGDYLTFGANQANLGLGTGDFTFEFWFNAATIPTTEVDIYESQTTNSLRVLKRASSSGLSFDPYGGTATLIMADASITTNTWHHVAISRTSGTTSAYYDGTRVVNQADSTNYATPTVNYGVGGRASGANYFNGYISNMRLVKGTGLYSGTTITVPTGPLTAVTNTQLLICNTNSFVDKSTNAFTITKNGDAKISAFQPFANSNTSRYTSVYFPAKTDYLAVRPQPSLTTFPGDFTFECWVYPTDTTLTSAWSIWDSRQAGATANPMIFSLTALASPVTGSWRLSYYNGTQYYGTGTVLWNQWTHVAFVRSGTTMTFYVNGVAGGTATISGTQTGNATTAPIYIGSKDNGLANYGTVGYIADFRITNGYARTITVPTAPYDIK